MIEFEKRLLVVALSAALGVAGCGGGGGGSTAIDTAGGGTVIIGDTGQPLQATSILNGASPPTNVVGADGDYFLDTASGRLYGPKAAGAWPAASLSLVGPAGPAGPTGATGPAGPVGVGGGGNAGGHLFSGTTAPLNILGSDGDFFLNTLTTIVVGPKAGGAWPAGGISIVGSIGPAGASGATGATGSAGANGAAGATGPAGATGAAGATGTTGAVGPTGPAGTSLLGGAGAPSNAVGADGDYFINGTSNTLIGPKAAGAWPALGISLVGPTGATGATGPIGATGATGATGASILAGAGTPSNGLGNDGDLYFDSSTRTVLGPKAAGSWPVAGTVLTGATGATGATGGTGLTGAIGPAGIDGKTVLSGGANPTVGQGANGDFFINTASSFLFGPKAGGAWPPGVSLVGATGLQGITGTTGATGAGGALGPVGAAGNDGKTLLNGTANPLPAQGANGDFYINTSISTLFGPKLAGAWPAGVSLLGPTGATGPAGPTGPIGLTGATGAAGPSGSIAVYDFGVFNLNPHGNGTFFMTGTGLALSTDAVPTFIVPANCATMTLRAYLIGNFTGHYELTVMRSTFTSPPHTLGPWIPSTAACSVTGGGARICTASASNFASGDLFRMRLAGSQNFNVAGNTSGGDNILAVSAVCK